MTNKTSEIIKKQNEVLSKPMTSKKDIDYFNKVMNGKIYNNEKISNNYKTNK